MISFSKTILITLLCLTSLNSKADLLSEYCDRYQGQVVKGFQCPKSRLYLPIRVCLFNNSANSFEFFDGCTGPTGAYKEIFYPSCIAHDFCYHHEPATNGKGRKYCDYRFYQGMLDACDDRASNINSCKKWAKNLYRSLRIVGWPAFHCENRRAN